MIEGLVELEWFRTLVLVIPHIGLVQIVDFFVGLALLTLLL